MSNGYFIAGVLICMYLYSLYLIIQKNIILNELKQKKNTLYSISQNICVNKDFMTEKQSVFIYFKEVFFRPLINIYDLFGTIFSLILTIIFIILLIISFSNAPISVFIIQMSLYMLIFLTCILFFTQSSIKVFSKEEENIFNILE